MVTERETYALLDWLGDIGGLFDALRILVGSLIAPFTTQILKVELLSSVFRSLKRDQPIGSV